MSEIKIADVKKVTVIGAGLMGAQIGELFARLAKCHVTLVDIKDEFVSKGLAGIDQRTEKFFVAKGKMTPEEKKELMSRIGGTTDLAKAAAEYKGALLIKPEFPEALLNLGNLLDASGEKEAARDHWVRALQLKPELVLGYYLT